VTRASEKLNVSQSTISGQLRELQEALGERLLTRSGRTLVFTDIVAAVRTHWLQPMVGAPSID
jgi:DNA-binding transcriptional LysR family regulator